MQEKYDRMQKSPELNEWDTFDFECTGCGGCCYNQHNEIILSGYDFFRLKKGLRLPSYEILRKYCDFMVGHSSRLPFHILSMDYFGACKFLKDKKCSCHEFKPITCALYPLGRAVMLNKTTNKMEVKYALTSKGKCSGKSNPILVSDWLKKFNIQNSETQVQSFFNFIMTLSDQEAIKLYTKKFDFLDKKIKFEISMFLYDILYEDFNLEEDYATQVNLRTEQLPDLINNSEIFKSLFIKGQGRNDMCSCGSGKKYKNCCLKK